MTFLKSRLQMLMLSDGPLSQSTHDKSSAYSVIASTDPVGRFQYISQRTTESPSKEDLDSSIERGQTHTHTLETFKILRFLRNWKVKHL